MFIKSKDLKHGFLLSHEISIDNKKKSNINKVQQLIRNSGVGAGDRAMDQWLKALVPFSEYLLQFPGPKGWRTSVCNSSSDVLFRPVVPGTVCDIHTHTQTLSHTK